MTSTCRMPCRSPNHQHGGIILKFLFLLFLGFCLLVLYVARRPLLRFAGNFWMAGGDPVHSDAIVLLGDDNYAADGAARAAELFKAGWAPRVVAGGRRLRPYASIADLEEHDRIAQGVPKTAIVLLEDRAENTEDEASAISRLISQGGWKQVLVVTSDYDTRRARYICEREFPAGTELRVLGAPEPRYDPDSWWSSGYGRRVFFHELVGMLSAAWDLRHAQVETEDSLALGSDWPTVAGLSHMRSITALFVYS